MYVVVGANGFLGSYIIKNILESTEQNIIAIARNIDSEENTKRITWISCDISDFNSVAELSDTLNKTKQKLKIVYLAAYHNPDLVEKNPKIAWNINITSLSYFINCIDNVDCFFYPSTDSVYGQSMDGYHFRESDALNPVNTYGKQKVVAEKLVIAYGYNVVRYPFLIAPSLSSKKLHFCDEIIKKLNNNCEITMFADSYRSTINFDEAAAILVYLMENYLNTYPKILNICGDNDLSKYDVGIMLADKLSKPHDLVIPISMTDNNNIFTAQRATSTLMDNTEIKKIIGRKEIKLTF